jgi:hypothetical protein
MGTTASVFDLLNLSFFIALSNISDDSYHIGDARISDDSYHISDGS